MGKSKARRLDEIERKLEDQASRDGTISIWDYLAGHRPAPGERILDPPGMNERRWQAINEELDRCFGECESDRIIRELQDSAPVILPIESDIVDKETDNEEFQSRNDPECTGPGMSYDE